MREMIKTFRIVVGKLNGRNHSEDLDLDPDGRLIKVL
jgi:hypothetical protein